MKEYKKLIDKNPNSKKTAELVTKVTKIKLQDPFIPARRNLVQHYFGNRELQFLNPKDKSKTMREVLTFARKIDYIYRHIIKIIKVNLVVRDLATLTWNIVSNFLLGILQGRNPVEEFKAQVEGAREIQRYEKDFKKAKQLEIKINSNNHTGSDIDELKRLRVSMNENPVKPLIDAGLYTAVTEDLSNEELHKEDFVDVWLKEHVEKHIPEGVKKVFDVLYLTKNTPVFHALLQAMQYSDFAARYSKYYSLINNGMMKEKAVKKVLDNQINYGFSHGKLLQWLNDRGFVMFSMFVEKIQRVVKNLTIEKPFSVIFAILGSDFIFDKSPLQDSIFTRDLGRMIFLPDEMVDEVFKRPQVFKIITNTY